MARILLKEGCCSRETKPNELSLDQRKYKPPHSGLRRSHGEKRCDVMSAISQGTKFSLGGFIKNLFHRSNGNGAATPATAPEPEIAPAPAPAPASPAPVRPAASSSSQAPVNGVVLPLQAILATFPLELQPKIRVKDTANITVTIPFDKILSQLSSGVVKLPYGHIRRAAPQVFAPGIEMDTVGVSLPLNEILSRLNPSLLTRRPVQKRIEVPEEIESPFAGKGDGLAFGVGNTQPEAPAAPAPAAPRAQPATKPGETTTFRRITPKSMLPQQPAAAAAAAAAHNADIEAPIFQRKPTTPPAPAAPANPELQSKPIAMPAMDDGAIFQRKPTTPPPATPANPIAMPAMDDAQIFQRKPTTPPPAVPANPIAMPVDDAAIFQRKPASPAPAVPANPELQSKPIAMPAMDDGAIFQRKPTTPPPVAPVNPIAMPVDDAAIFQRKPATPAPAAPAVPAMPISMAQPTVTPEPVADESALHISPFAPVTPITPAAPAVPASPLAPVTPITPPPRPKDFLANPPVARPSPGKPTGSTPSSAGTATIAVPLTALAESWPETVRQDIVQLKLVDARLAMPADLVEASLKRGRVAFPWKTVRSWIRPATNVGPSAHDATEVELPLAVIAPMFLARQKAAAKLQKPEIDETIPNLFFGLPKPEPSATPKPADTNYYVWGDTSDSARVDDTDFKRKAGGTDFVSRYATPNEIVSRAAVLDGVAGVIIALPDGLMVASRIPPEFNGDTLAAFLPQIFSKVTQCTKELRMGELNNLNFTIGNVPWKIFRVNAIFFAAFGRAGEALPSAELAGLAAELDRKRTS